MTTKRDLETHLEAAQKLIRVPLEFYWANGGVMLMRADTEGSGYVCEMSPRMTKPEMARYLNGMMHGAAHAKPREVAL